MPLRRLVILALLAGAIGAFVASLLRPRARRHPIAAVNSIATNDPVAIDDRSGVTG